MKKTIMGLVIINILLMSLLTIDSLNSLLRGTILRPTRPSMGVVAFFIILTVMNFVILRYVASSPQAKIAKSKGWDAKKLLIGIGWFTIINCVTNALAGGIIGFMAAGASQGEPTMVGREAARDFFAQYGWIIFVFSAMVSIIGTKSGKLPYTKPEVKSASQ